MKDKILFFVIGLFVAFAISFFTFLAVNRNTPESSSIDKLKQLDENLNENEIQSIDYDNAIEINVNNYSKYIKFEVKSEKIDGGKDKYTVIATGKDGITINNIKINMDVTLTDKDGNYVAKFNVNDLHYTDGNYIFEREYFENEEGYVYKKANYDVKDISAILVK